MPTGGCNKSKQQSSSTYRGVSTLYRLLKNTKQLFWSSDFNLTQITQWQIVVNV